MRTTSMRNKIGLLLLAAVLLTGAGTKMNTEQMNYRFPATGGVLRPLTSRLSDLASVKDFGAVCDGIADDTAAVNKAVATGKPVITPDTACFTTGALGLIPGGSIVMNGTNILKVGGDLSGTLPNPTVVATHLTAPLPVNSGGTGTGVLGPCGPGVLTSDGTTVSCTTLSGLAPPGTTGVLLQAVTPGSPQVGHVNLNGDLVSSNTQPPTATAWGSNASFRSAGGLFLSGTPNVGAVVAGGWSGSLSVYPANFNTNTQSSGANQYSWFGPRTANPLMAWVWDTASGGLATGSTSCNTGVGCISTVYSGCQSASSASGPPCISTGAAASGTSTPLFIGGQVSANSTNNRVITTTGAINLLSGNLFENWNNGVSKFSVGFNGNLTAAGTVTTTGVTSSGPVGGTTGTFSGAVSAPSYGAVSGTTGTFSGAVSASSYGAVSGTTGAFSGLVTFNGGVAAAAPIPQAAGGTGAGALTCAAGSYLTSNGTSYSCSPSTVAVYYSFNSGSLSLGAVAGSSCNVQVITTTMAGSTAGFGCVATSSPVLGTVPITLTCEMTGGTSANLRLCNTGVNAVTPPASTTYYIKVFP